MAVRSLHAGAAGYVVKGEDKNALLRAIQQVVAGGNVWTTEQSPSQGTMLSMPIHWDAAEERAAVPLGTLRTIRLSQMRRKTVFSMFGAKHAQLKYSNI